MNMTSHGSIKDLDIPMPYETCMVVIDFYFDFFFLKFGGGVGGVGFLTRYQKYYENSNLKLSICKLMSVGQ